MGRDKGPAAGPKASHPPPQVKAAPNPSLDGLCLLCGDEVDETYDRTLVNCYVCGGSTYHRGCLDRYVKRVQTPRDIVGHKNGLYPCPRWTGKIKHEDGLLCKGKVASAHAYLAKKPNAKPALPPMSVMVKHPPPQKAANPGAQQQQQQQQQQPARPAKPAVSALIPRKFHPGSNNSAYGMALPPRVVFTVPPPEPDETVNSNEKRVIPGMEYVKNKQKQKPRRRRTNANGSDGDAASVSGCGNSVAGDAPPSLAGGAHSWDGSAAGGGAVAAVDGWEDYSHLLAEDAEHEYNNNNNFSYEVAGQDDVNARSDEWGSIPDGSVVQQQPQQQGAYNGDGNGGFDFDFRSLYGQPGDEQYWALFAHYKEECSAQYRSMYTDEELDAWLHSVLQAGGSDGQHAQQQQAGAVAALGGTVAAAVAPAGAEAYYAALAPAATPSFVVAPAAAQYSTVPAADQSAGATVTTAAEDEEDDDDLLALLLGRA